MKDKQDYTLSPLARMMVRGQLKRYVDPLKGIDVEKEYPLVVNKTSKLSAAKRAAVVAAYEKLHREKDSDVPAAE